EIEAQQYAQSRKAPDLSLIASRSRLQLKPCLQHQPRKKPCLGGGNKPTMGYPYSEANEVYHPEGILLRSRNFQSDPKEPERAKPRRPISVDNQTMPSRTKGSRIKVRSEERR